MDSCCRRKSFAEKMREEEEYQQLLMMRTQTRAIQEKNNLLHNDLLLHHVRDDMLTGISYGMASCVCFQMPRVVAVATVGTGLGTLFQISNEITSIFGFQSTSSVTMASTAANAFSALVSIHPFVLVCGTCVCCSTCLWQYSKRRARGDRIQLQMVLGDKLYKEEIEIQKQARNNAIGYVKNAGQIAAAVATGGASAAGCVALSALMASEQQEETKIKNNSVCAGNMLIENKKDK
jgi:hypothetical protein